MFLCLERKERSYRILEALSLSKNARITFRRTQVIMKNGVKKRVFSQVSINTW